LSVASSVLSARAASDLREIHDYIAADDPSAARCVLEDLRDAMHRLAELPGLGHLRDDLADETLRVDGALLSGDLPAGFRAAAGRPGARGYRDIRRALRVADRAG
jgi:plasmid stabilization system protein ParE